MKVLFICEGNLCRSVMAEKLFEASMRRRGKPAEARSCGLAAATRLAVPSEVRAILKQAGVPAFEHQATPIDQNLLDWADVAITMTEVQLEAVQDRFPKSAGKVALLREKAGFPDFDVEDPFVRTEADYRACAARIAASIERLAA